MSHWRTPTIVDICAAIRQEGSYDMLPILSDALQESGFDDEQVIAKLRSPLNTIDAQRLLAILYSDETAEAVRKIEEMAEELGDSHGDDYYRSQMMDYRFLMEVAETYLATFSVSVYGGDGDRFVQQGSERWRDEFNAAKFWPLYEKVTGVTPPEQAGGIFCCTC